jgi:hypothetical protein
MRISTNFFISLPLFLCSSTLIAQKSLWQDGTEPINVERRINPSVFRTVSVNFETLKAELLNAPKESSVQAAQSSFIISLPHPNGETWQFRVVESPIFEPALQAKFPDIRTFTGQGFGDKAYATLKMDFGPNGFHAMVLTPGNAWFIDPISTDNLDLYMSYTRGAFFDTNTKTFAEEDPKQQFGQDMRLSPEKVEQQEKEILEKHGKKPNTGLFKTTNGTQLRTYRLALACTGEYANFHGSNTTNNNKAFALAAMTTTMNRVNGVFERDMSLRMNMVGNTDLLIFLNASTDPYTNNNGGTMLGQNQTTCDNIIGSSNYDIGHVFSTGGGGVAYLNAVCNNSIKAGGVTGQSSPVGDPFDIDYVAHEMGHQWGAAHTQNNSCNRSSTSAYEPGSASTIMGYAGICPPNLQNNSDDHFHNRSFNQMYSFSVTGSGNSCAVASSNGNTPPTVTVPTGGFTIPISTPFELTATATDPNGDILTYCWEQYDLGPATATGDNDLTNPSGNAPIFRSWSPTLDPTRVFPRIQNLVNNTTVIGELLPTYTRDLTFRCTVRDNRAGGGGVTDAQVAFAATSTAGPFVVTAPNTAVTWNGNSTQTVTWNVANTTASPVNCANVNIFLSTDGGFTYPITLATNVPNNGSASITVPNISTNQARVKVKAANNIFFDISNQNFTIIPGATNNFDISLSTINAPTETICSTTFAPQITVTNLGIQTVTSFTVTYNVDGGTNSTFNWTGSLATGASAVVNLPNVTTTAGAHTFNVTLSGPNGQPDAVPGNNTGSSAFSVGSACTCLSYCSAGATNTSFEKISNVTFNTINNNSTGGIGYQDFTNLSTTVTQGSTYPLSVTISSPDNNDEIRAWIDWNQNGVFDSGEQVMLVVTGSAGPHTANVTVPAGATLGSTRLRVRLHWLTSGPNNTPCGTSTYGQVEDYCLQIVSGSPIAGCTNPAACNYNSAATVDNGSCTFPGCTDPAANNYNPSAGCSDGSCTYGCAVVPPTCVAVGSAAYNQVIASDPFCCNNSWDSICQNAYNALSNTCIGGCTDPTAINYNPNAGFDDGSCTYGTCTSFTLTIFTDCWGGETSWNLVGPGGNTIASITPGTLANQTTYTWNFCLVDGCYTFNILDTYGDGLNGTLFGCPVNGNYFITNNANGQVVVQMGAPNFGFGTSHTFCVSSAVAGCTNPAACNFNPAATVDDGSCALPAPTPGCVDTSSAAYATVLANDPFCCNVAWDSICQNAYNALNSSCLGCTDPSACNYNPAATTNNGSCTYPGCTNPSACNYNAAAGCDNGSCTFPGCTNPSACNYNPTAGCDNGSCVIPPVNDQCAGAIALTVNGGATAVSNVGSCVNAPNPTCGNATQIQDIWFSFVYSGGNITINASGGSIGSKRIAVYTACGGTQLACNTGTNTNVNLTCPTLQIGQSYRIQAGGNAGNTGTFNINITSTAVNGCTDPTASNYNACATNNTGCIYPGCTDASACNFNPGANQNDGSCTYPGCTNPSACNYNAAAGCDNGSCTLPGCTNPSACNYDASAGCDNGSCVLPAPTPGCVDTSSAAYATVLANDPFCCNVSWDNICQNAYNALNPSCLGCTDSSACNYNPAATTNNGSCTYPGCTNTSACNYNPAAGCDDGSCSLPGCTNPSACNYDASAGCDNGSCVLPAPTPGCVDTSSAAYATVLANDPFCCNVAWDSICQNAYNALNPSCLGCTDSSACNYNPAATTNNGSCTYPGCTNPAACNYNAAAGCDNGSCTLPGCTNPSACNYDASAGCDNGSCVLPAPTPGCVDTSSAAYATVLANDPFCCNVSWDNICQNAYNALNPSCLGCTDSSACNYNPDATTNNGSCTYPGCTDPSACNYNAAAECDDGSCNYSCGGTCLGDFNGDGVVNFSDLSILLSEYGCVSGCITDLNADGVVNFQDLSILLANFGLNCP